MLRSGASFITKQTHENKFASLFQCLPSYRRHCPNLASAFMGVLGNFDAYFVSQNKEHINGNSNDLFKITVMFINNSILFALAAKNQAFNETTMQCYTNNSTNIKTKLRTLINRQTLPRGLHSLTQGGTQPSPQNRKLSTTQNSNAKKLKTKMGHNGTFSGTTNAQLTTKQTILLDLPDLFYFK